VRPEQARVIHTTHCIHDGWANSQIGDPISRVAATETMVVPRVTHDRPSNRATAHANRSRIIEQTIPQ
jgi:hypothetical protein